MSQSNGYYRTNSHSGLPKGSYAVPNPMHFHIVRQTHIARVMKPKLCGTFGLDHNNSRFDLHSSVVQAKNRNPRITIDLNQAHSVSLKIPRDVVYNFIYPFAKAFNICRAPTCGNAASQTSYFNDNNSSTIDPSTSTTLISTASSQTSYVKDVASQSTHTTLVQDFSDSSGSLSSVSEFEQQILDNLQNNLIIDIQNFQYDSLSYLDIIDETKDTFYSLNPDFSDDEMNPNESIVELTDEVLAIMSIMDSSNDTADSRKDLFMELPFSFFEQPDKNRITENNKSDQSPDLFDSDLSEFNESKENSIRNLYLELPFPNYDYSDNDDTYTISSTSTYVVNDGVINLTLERVEGRVNSLNQSVDEGIMDCTFVDSPPNKSYEPSDNVVVLSGIVLDYLVQQCYEVKELILFPEILHDSNVNKFLAKLKYQYDLMCGCELTNEEKNKLRIAICSHVLKRLEANEKINECDNDTSLGVISDKLFSISEFLSDILDLFFNFVNGNSTLSTDDNGDHVLNLSNDKFEVLNCKTMSSTPRKQVQNQVEIVTAFKKGVTKSRSGEAFWFSITNSPVEKEVAIRENVINVDDIPLKPPPDLNFSNSSDTENDKPNAFWCPLGDLPLKEDDKMPNTSPSVIQLESPQDIKPSNFTDKPVEIGSPDEPGISYLSEACRLSPILEEGVSMNLFSSTFTQNCTIDNKFDDDISDIEIDKSNQRTSPIKGILKKNETSNYIDDTTDNEFDLNILFSGNKSYYSVDQPGQGLVLYDMTLLRNDSNNPSFSNKKTVTFKQNSDDDGSSFKTAENSSDENKENVSNEGNWMGYDSAIF